MKMKFTRALGMLLAFALPRSVCGRGERKSLVRKLNGF